MNPWEKYASPSPEQDAGPWAKYAAPESADVPRGTNEPQEQIRSEPSYLEGRIAAFKEAFSPQRWAQELTSFPPITKETTAQVLNAGEEAAITASPVTQFGKAARFAVAGKPAPSTSVEKLVAEGVTPTIGQRIGGAAKRTEEALTSVPILGDVIKSSQRQGIEEFNRAAINRTLKPIEKTLPKGVNAGHEAVDFAHTELSKSYDELLPKLVGRADSELFDSLKSVDDFAQTIPESQAKQLQQIIQTNVLNKFDKSGMIYGENLKDAMSRVGKLVRQYKKSENPDHQLLGESLEHVKDSLSAMLARTNPQHAERLRRIDTGYANLVRVEKAASSSGSKGGVFTPSQLNQAVRATDSTVRKSGFARGKSLMQDLATSGQDVLTQSVPDSGTALRLAPYLVAGGAGVAGESGYLSPGTAAAIAGMSLAYTRPGQRAVGAIGRGFSSQRGQRAAYGGAAAFSRDD